MVSKKYFGVIKICQLDNWCIVGDRGVNVNNYLPTLHGAKTSDYWNWAWDKNYGVIFHF